MDDFRLLIPENSLPLYIVWENQYPLVISHDLEQVATYIRARYPDEDFEMYSEDTYNDLHNLGVSCGQFSLARYRKG